MLQQLLKMIMRFEVKSTKGKDALEFFLRLLLRWIKEGDQRLYWLQDELLMLMVG